MTLGSIQPPTETSTRNIYVGGKRGRCLGLTTLPPTRADCLEIWVPRPPGTVSACSDLQWDCFAFYSVIFEIIQCAVFGIYRYASFNDGVRSEKCVVGDFVVARTCTYTSLDSIAYCTPRLYCIAYCC